MSFFEPLPSEAETVPPVRRPREPWEQPDFVLPGTVAQHLLVARTDSVAVSVGSIRAYPNGFEFTVHARRRPDSEPNASRDPLAWNRSVDGSLGGLRFGLLFADGRRVTNADQHGGGWADPSEVHLMGNGGSGSENTWDGNFWVHPLPPDGPLAFVVTWPNHDLGEVRATLDATAIRLAAADAVPLWPEEDGSMDANRSRQLTSFVVVPDEDEDG